MASAITRIATACALLFLGVGTAVGQPAGIAAAPAGLNEAGVPAFTISTPAALGLSSAPTDLHPLPDGRIVALANLELAIGDGTRWEVFRAATDDTPAHAAMLAVGGDGTLYTGMPSQFARIEFRPDGRLQRVPVAATPDPLLVPSHVYAAGGEWYWYGGSGGIVRWHPGNPPVTVARIADLERAISLGGETFLSDRADGAFWRLGADEAVPLITAAETNVSHTITCGIDLGDKRYVVGTNGHGLQHFAAHRLTPIPPGGPLAGAGRINDLCTTAGGLFAAAVDNFGVVFFDRDLRTVQVLDHSLDHRLARVRRLFATSYGEVWGLLNDGIVRIEFPSRISRYESMVSTGLIYAQPYRYQGRLWLIGDGLAQRGMYDSDGRLLRFEVDSPPDEFLGQLSTNTGALLAGGRRGLYRRTGGSWQLVLPGIVNPHLANTADAEGRWAFVAEGSVGWIRPNGDNYELAQYPAPQIGAVFGAANEATGVLWAELGVARLARLELAAREPQAEVFGPEAGLAGGWAQLSILNGEVRVDISGQILEFDPRARRFVPDTDFHDALPPGMSIIGRPVFDARGRLWVATATSPYLLERDGSVFRRKLEPLPQGFLPVSITPDAGGPVWLHQRLQLLRYDPDLPQAPIGHPRVLITRIVHTNSGQESHLPRGQLTPLPFTDNSLVVHFMSVGATPSQTLTFEVRLVGESQDWASTGVVGSAVFNQLKEGHYTLQVRPVVNGEPGVETALGLQIEPAWFRTHAAYATYILLALLGVGGIARYANWRAEHDKQRLAQLVDERTHELHAANRQLAANIEDARRQADALRASEERARRLSNELERRVAERTDALVRANEQLVATNQELESFSYSISHDLRAPLRNINGFVDLLRRRNRDKLDPESSRFFQIIATETIRLSELIDSLLAFARLSRADFRYVPVDLGAIVTQVIAEFRSELEQRTVEWKIAALPVVTADAALIRQVLANLVANAIKFTRHRTPAIIEIGVAPPDPVQPQEDIFFIRDNGAGFDPKYSGKLFGVFQRLHSVREFEGTGIGLANAKRIILRHGGRIWAESRQGAGATFYFSLPKQPVPPA